MPETQEPLSTRATNTREKFTAFGATEDGQEIYRRRPVEGDVDERGFPPPSDAPRDDEFVCFRGSANANPQGISFWGLVKEDYDTHGTLFAQGFWVLFVHRFGNWRMGFPRLLRLPMSLCYKFMYNWIHWICAVELPYIVPLGRRIRIAHHGGNVLGARYIGDDVYIRHNSTTGIGGGPDMQDMPIIEDRVMIGGGAYILGGIRVGHDTIIGANSVVTRDIPPFSIVVGSPAKVIKKLPEEPLHIPKRPPR